jgi:leucyl aminopeptidase (aminopeptidase T)
MEIASTAKLIVETCLDIKEGDKVLIIACSDEDPKMASILAAKIKAAQAEVQVSIVEPQKEVEPPSFLAEAMKKMDVVIALGQVQFGHTLARKRAAARGVKYAYLPDLMVEEIGDVEVRSGDLLEIEALTERLADRVSRAGEIRVSAANGTDIVFNIKGRKGLALHPVFRNPGHFAIIPFYSEVSCAPVEGTALGKVVINGTIIGLPGLNGVVEEVICWYVKDGKVVEIEGGSEARLLQDLLSKLDRNASRIAEVGIGTNYKLPDRLIGTRRDNAILGSVHLGLGRNIDLGGSLFSQVHADFLAMNVKVELDGRAVIKDGRFLG